MVIILALVSFLACTRYLAINKNSLSKKVRVFLGWFDCVNGFYMIFQQKQRGEA
jgi:hypothetical protein